MVVAMLDAPWVSAWVSPDTSVVSSEIVVLLGALAMFEAGILIENVKVYQFIMLSAVGELATPW